MVTNDDSSYANVFGNIHIIKIVFWSLTMFTVLLALPITYAFGTLNLELHPYQFNNINTFFEYT